MNGSPLVWSRLAPFRTKLRWENQRPVKLFLARPSYARTKASVGLNRRYAAAKGLVDSTFLSERIENCYFSRGMLKRCGERVSREFELFFLKNSFFNP
jgi:hypothetical protein